MPEHGSIISDMNWVPIEVARTTRYTAHERIQNFLQQTALPPAGVLQSSCSVGVCLWVDFLAAPSDNPVDASVGGRLTTRQQDPAVDATSADGAASDVATATQRIRRRQQQQRQLLSQAGTPPAAAAAACVAVAAAAAEAAPLSRSRRGCCRQGYCRCYLRRRRRRRHARQSLRCCCCRRRRHRRRCCR